MKVATFAQEGNNGTTSRDRASEVSCHKESVAPEASCLSIDLNRASHGDNCYHP